MLVNSGQFEPKFGKFRPSLVQMGRTSAPGASATRARRLVRRGAIWRPLSSACSGHTPHARNALGRFWMHFSETIPDKVRPPHAFTMLGRGARRSGMGVVKSGATSQMGLHSRLQVPAAVCDNLAAQSWLPWPVPSAALGVAAMLRALQDSVATPTVLKHIKEQRRCEKAAQEWVRIHETFVPRLSSGLESFCLCHGPGALRTLEHALRRNSGLLLGGEELKPPADQPPPLVVGLRIADPGRAP